MRGRFETVQATPVGDVSDRRISHRRLFRVARAVERRSECDRGGGSRDRVLRGQSLRGTRSPLRGHPGRAGRAAAHRLRRKEAGVRPRKDSGLRAAPDPGRGRRTLRGGAREARRPSAGSPGRKPELSEREPARPCGRAGEHPRSRLLSGSPRLRRDRTGGRMGFDPVRCLLSVGAADRGGGTPRIPSRPQHTLGRSQWSDRRRCGRLPDSPEPSLLPARLAGSSDLCIRRVLPAARDLGRQHRPGSLRRARGRARIRVHGCTRTASRGGREATTRGA